MFALFGLISLIIKIAFLATAYAILTLLILYILSQLTKIKWIKKIMQHKFKSWFGAGFIYSIIFFCYAFSYRGYAGLGDYFCIPAGNGFVVSSIDALETSYFEPDNRKKYSRQVFLKNFAIKDGKICGEFLGYNSDNCVDCFIVFDTHKEKIQEFNSSKDYLIYASKNNLPQQQDLTTFNENYQRHWGGLKKWFLP